MFVILCSVMSAVNITTNINSISMLNGSNLKSRQENPLIVLSTMDLNLVLRVGSPPTLTNKSTSDDNKDLEKLEKSNPMCVMITNKIISEAFGDYKSKKITMVKEFLA